jgi:hypothetical protein
MLEQSQGDLEAMIGDRLIVEQHHTGRATVEFHLSDMWHGRNPTPSHHVFRSENRHMIDALQAKVDQRWERLLKLCGEA